MNHLNLRLLEEISSGDPQKMQRLLSAFMEEAPKTFSLMKDACSGKKFEELARMAHTLKPLYLSIGAEKASSVIKNIEDYSRSAFFRELIPVEMNELEQLNKSIFESMNLLLKPKF